MGFADLDAKGKIARGAILHKAMVEILRHATVIVALVGLLFIDVLEVREVSDRATPPTLI